MEIPSGPPTVRSGISARILGADEVVGAAARVAAPIPDARYELVRAAEAAAGGAGKVTESAPGRFAWEGASMLVRDTVTLEEHEDGTTTIEARSDRMGRYLLSWGIAFIALAVAVSYVGDPFVSLRPILQIVVPAFLPVLLGRPLWKQSQRRAGERLQRSVTEMARLLEEGADAGPFGGAGDAPGA